ncbi:MAG: crossover junction endodeoxyribonuclease RuvC [Spirochaetales bacterium]|nr:crossover junction endodeoxyribonuclease RuvC [Spirochaetales bacterium]
MRRIIGIDPGLSATGYGIIEIRKNKISHICHGVIRTDPEYPMQERLVIINNELKQVLVQMKPDEASVELIYFAKNMKTAIPVAQARGVILLSLAQAGIPVNEYTPLEVKQSVAGRGRADKVQIQNMIKIILQLKEIPSPDHAADALAIAYCHSSHSIMERFMKMGK